MIIRAGSDIRSVMYDSISLPSVKPCPFVKRSVSFQQRLLTEAVRHFEAGRGAILAESQAEQAARDADGDLETRLVARAQALSVAPALETALGQIRHAVTLSVALLALFALLAGGTAARLVFWPPGEQPVNVYGLLAGILGAPLLALLVWLVLLALRPGALVSASLGGLAHALGRRLSGKLHHDAPQAAAARASTTLLAGGAVGRWSLSAASHALWLSYLLGALTMTLFLLSVQQYRFAWETTILSADSYITLTRALGWLPGLFGFATPDATQIAASQWQGGEAPLAAGAAWSGLVLGSLVVYGILPRLVLLIACLGLRRRALGRFRLDPTLPGYARLQDRLQPLSRSLGVVDAEDAVPEPRPTPPPVSRPEPDVLGPPAILGLEIERPEHWPPLAADWLDLGCIDDRAGRRRTLERLQTTEPPPSHVVVACSIAMTPDRGSGRFLEQLAALGRPLVLLLSEGQRMRRRGQGNDLAQRVADWRSLGQSAGIDDAHVVELDLDHLTEHSRARLAALLEVPETAATDSHIDAAFTLIVDHVGRWRRPPDEAAQAELHRAIARLYGNAPRDFRLPLPNADTLRSAPKQRLQQSAERIRRLLPARLHADPRWLATGALAGAMGCVAIATVTAPAALSALPFWSVLGAALALFTRPSAGEQAVPAADYGQPVSAAALFTLLLELQGRDEAAITRALDELLDERAPTLADAGRARTWLDSLRRRYGALREREAA